MIYTIVKYKKDEKTVEAIFSFDAVNSVQEQWSASVAKTTVESGFPVSDHINVENPKFNISGKITSYSLYKDTSEIYWNGSDFVTDSDNSMFDYIEGKKSLIGIFTSRSYIRLFETTKNSFSNDFDLKVEQLKSEKYNIYPNCVITSLSFGSSEGNFSSFDVQVSIEQLNIASVVTTQLSAQEMTPRLFGYEKTSTTASSSSTSSNSNTGEVGSEVSSDKSNPTSSKSSDDNVMQETLEKQLKEGKAAIIRGRHAVEVREIADKATAATGFPHRVIEYGDGSYSIIKVKWSPTEMVK